MAKEHLKYESTEIDRRLDLAGTALQEHQDISHLATKEEVASGLATKENVIEDLAEIRRGAGLGATALQEHQDISHLATKTKVAEDLAKKVDKVSGKQLSTEDYTTAEKTKLRGLYNYDDTTVKASIKSVEDKVKTKQDIVQDLETIRQGASKGATAIQEVKTINGESIVGKGNIEIKGGGGSSYDDTEIKQNINELSAEVHEKLEGEVIATSEATEDFDFRYDDSEIRQELSELSDRMDDFTPSSITNITWAELKALRDEGKLIAGQMYRMTDYETTCTWENTQVAGHPFDLVLTALDNKTLDEKCSAIWSERDTDGYFANSNLAAWDVRYCLDNDTNRFEWAQQKGKYLYANDGYDDYIGVLDGTIVIDGQTYFKWSRINYDSVLMTAVENPKQGDEIYVAYTGDEEEYWNAVVTQFREAEDGKGVIFRLTDEFMNSTPYDFKNIMFSRPLIDGKFDIVNGVDTFCYSCSFYNESSLKIEDNSIWGGGMYIGDGSKDVVSFGDCVVVGKFCSAISFGGNSSCCTKDNCYNISVGEFTRNVTVMDSCSDIDIKAWLSNISIGNHCLAVVVDGSEITIGNNCSDIYINGSCSSINIRESCTNINIAKNSQHIYFGEQCQDISLEPSESDSSHVYYRSIIFMGGNGNIVITNSDTTISYRFVQNIKIAIGLSGDSQPIFLDIKELDIPHMLTVAKNSAGDIKVYCEADLVQ